MKGERGIYSEASWKGCHLKIFPRGIFRDTSWSITTEEEADPFTVSKLGVISYLLLLLIIILFILIVIKVSL